MITGTAPSFPNWLKFPGEQDAHFCSPLNLQRQAGPVLYPEQVLSQLEAPRPLSLSLPPDCRKDTHAYSNVKDALVQWGYPDFSIGEASV